LVGGVPTGARAIGLDHRPQHAPRHPLGNTQCYQNSPTRGGAGCESTRRNPDWWHIDNRPDASGNPHCANRICNRCSGAGFIDNLARPGGNATGFLLYEYSLAGKWLELLKQIAPTITRVAVVRDSDLVSGTGQFAAIQAVAPSLKVDVVPVNMREAADLERTVAAFARSPNGGLILTGSGLSILHRDQIITLAARHKLPAIYYERFFVSAGGLISYGSDRIELYRLAAGYVDRILRGEKPANLPVQAPTKFELVINLKTAKALGLTVPSTLLATATETIQ
jgi:putative tryptophan/tyrosine transport system substrate-binding protein